MILKHVADWGVKYHAAAAGGNSQNSGGSGTLKTLVIVGYLHRATCLISSITDTTVVLLSPGEEMILQYDGTMNPFPCEH